MKTFDALGAARGAVSSAPSRPGTAMLGESPNARMLVFRLQPGQSLPPHQNGSSVMVTVLEGDGVFLGAEGERHCAAGEVVMYEPSEMHGITALDRELLVLVTIAPNPSARTEPASGRTA